jgi:protocatechuate 3,4-dioxygenase beta subunit
MSASSKFYFRPAQGEQIETVIHMEPDQRSAISGIVRDRSDQPVEGALVLLFQAEREGILYGRQFTDDEGRFFFGPIESEVLYLIRIYKNQIKIRELEIVAD